MAKAPLFESHSRTPAAARVNWTSLTLKLRSSVAARLLAAVVGQRSHSRDNVRVSRVLAIVSAGAVVLVVGGWTLDEAT